MKLAGNQGKKTRNKFLVFIIIFAFVVVATVVLLFKDRFSSWQEESGQNYLVEIKTDKIDYTRGENIKFTVTNKGQRTVWYVAAPQRCEKNVYFTVMKKNDDSLWNSRSLWPICDISKDNTNLIKVKELKPQESVSGVWDQKVLSDKNKEGYVEQGVYKILFYYSKTEITTGSVELSSYENVSSNEFEIRIAADSNIVLDKIRKANDAKRKADLNKIRMALEIYAIDRNSKYPTSDNPTKLNDENRPRTIAPEAVTVVFLFIFASISKPDTCLLKLIK